MCPTAIGALDARKTKAGAPVQLAPAAVSEARPASSLTLPGRPRALRVPPGTRVEIGVVHARRRDPDQHLSRAGTRYRNVAPILQAVESAVTREQHRTHPLRNVGSSLRYPCHR